MRNRLAVSAAGVALACSFTASLQAHHSGYMYETTPIWVKGTVVRFEHIDPHTVITIEDRNERGEVLRWGVEGPGQSQLGRMGIDTDTPTVGDVIEFCAFPYKPVEELSRMFPAVDFSARRASTPADGSSSQYVAGHVMVMSDGEKRLWEPHGAISACIGSSDDQRQSWLDLLNANARARQAWCDQRRYAHVQSSASLRQLVEEVDRVIDDPCE